jgi:hypothetical protein
MPQTTKYLTNAARQAAYRKRQKEVRTQEQTQQGLPALPAIPSLPGAARWSAALLLASQLLASTVSEMADYHQARSERWQESERGQTFAERLDELTPLSEQLETLL